MSGIVAIFNRRGSSDSSELLDTILRTNPERGPNGFAQWQSDIAGLGHQHFHLLPEDTAERQPIVTPDLVVSADCRLDNRAELARLLNLDPLTATKTGDATFILLAYRRWGTRCPEYLRGDFAFMVWERENKRLFAARDRLGLRDLCYHITTRLAIIASQPSHILAHPEVIARINDNRIAAFLTHLQDHPEETYYQDIYYLAPAHALLVTHDTHQLWSYWSATPTEIRYRDEGEYAQHYRQLLTQAVQDRLRCSGPIAVSMSGGLDSTSVAALAIHLLPQAHTAGFKSISYAFDELASCDERDYILPVVERLNLDPVFIGCDDCWTLKDYRQWPVSRDWVLADPFVLLPMAAMQAAAKAGIRLLLSGYYGDLLMSGGHYWALDMFRHGHLNQLARTTIENWGTIKWRRSFMDYGLRRLIPPEVASSYRRIRPRQSIEVAPGIRPEFIAKTNVEQRLSPPLPPPHLRSPGMYQRYQSMTLATISQGISATRNQYNTHGIELGMPYFDTGLVEFVLSVPAYILGRPGNWRALHRQAMAGILPEAVRLRKQRTVFVPLMVKGLRDKESDTVRHIFQKPQVVERGYINSDWLAAQLEKPYEPSPDSSFLWRVLCLELWLQRYWS